MGAAGESGWTARREAPGREARRGNAGGAESASLRLAETQKTAPNRCWFSAVFLFIR